MPANCLARPALAALAPLAVALAPLAVSLGGCWGDNAYIVEGTVVSLQDADTVVIHHEEIPGFMKEMTMPFDVADPKLLEGVTSGDRVYARLIVESERSYLANLRVTGKGELPAPRDGKAPEGGEAAVPAPVRPGEKLPTFEATTMYGEAITLGEGQGEPTLLTFLYTTCPLPDYCPAITNRLQLVQSSVKGELAAAQDTAAVAADGTSVAGKAWPARLVAVTLDPEGDTPEVLRAYAEQSAATPGLWTFARVDADTLRQLAGHAALTSELSGDEILHSLRTLVLTADGTLLERYDDARFPPDRVAKQLLTGEPQAPAGSDGTLTPPTE